MLSLLYYDFIKFVSEWYKLYGIVILAILVLSHGIFTATIYCSIS